MRCPQASLFVRKRGNVYGNYNLRHDCIKITRPYDICKIISNTWTKITSNAKDERRPLIRLWQCIYTVVLPVGIWNCNPVCPPSFSGFVNLVCGNLVGFLGLEVGVSQRLCVYRKTQSQCHICALVTNQRSQRYKVVRVWVVSFKFLCCTIDDFVSSTFTHVDRLRPLPTLIFIHDNEDVLDRAGLTKQVEVNNF